MHKFIITEKGIKAKNNLLIRKFDKLKDNELELLRSARLENIAPVEAWTAIGTNHQLAYATHGMFRYFGKFPPPIATYLIDEFTEEEDFVFDLMSGSGTTAVESILLNRRSLVNDVSPLSRLLASVKTQKIDEESLVEAIDRIEINYKPLTEKEYDYNPIGLRNPDHWFLAETKDSLRGIIKLINEEVNDDIKNFLLVAFSGIVRRVSRATTQQGRLFLDVETAEENALPFFLKKARNNVKAINELPENSVKPIIENYNLLEELPQELNSKADLVILHPPYFNSYKYSSVNSLELAWLQLDHAEVRKREVREFFKRGLPEKYVEYIEDMLKVIKHATKVLKPGKVMALMIGDTIMKGEHIKVTRELLNHINLNELEVELIAIRVPKYTEAAWVTSQRRDANDIGITLNDYIIILRRVA